MVKMKCDFKKQSVKKWPSQNAVILSKKGVYIVYAKYQTVSVKAVVGVEFLAHALSSTIQNYKGQ